MNARTNWKKAKLPFYSDFIEDLPREFLRAQETEVEPSWTTTDKQGTLDVKISKRPHSKGHRRSTSELQGFTPLQPPTQRYSILDLDLASFLMKPAESPSKLSADFCQSDTSDMAEIVRELTTKSPAKRPVFSLLEDDLMIIDLHTTMSKIQHQRLLETEKTELKKQFLKQQLLEHLSQLKEKEGMVTPRIHWNARASNASIATQEAAGSSFLLDDLLTYPATQKGLTRPAQEEVSISGKTAAPLPTPITKDEESCLVNIEDLDFPSVLLTAFQTVFKSVPSSYLIKAQRAVETMVNSTLVVLIDSSQAFQGLYRLNQTYKLLHKLTGYDSAPTSIPCSAVKSCFTFSPQSLSFKETESQVVTQSTHAVLMQ
jgi:hypothetical protein